MTETELQLSDQAVGALMMALQKSLMEQSDIVPVIGRVVFNFHFEIQLFITIFKQSFLVFDTSYMTALRGKFERLWQIGLGLMGKHNSNSSLTTGQ